MSRKIYREEDLTVRRRARKKLKVLRVLKPPPASKVNERWSMDFVRNTLSNGRVFKAFTIVGDFPRECSVIGVDGSLSGERIVRVLDKLRLTGGLPKTIACGNGPEFIGKSLGVWAEGRRFVFTLFNWQISAELLYREL